MAYAYTPAFVAFCFGTSAEEISKSFNIPIKSLKAKMRQESWLKLAERLTARTMPEPALHESILDKIETNRAKNYEIAAELRIHLAKIIEALRDGKLRIKKHFHHKGQIVKYEAEPSPADCLAIVTYARTIADMTYRALGDHEGNGGYMADASPGTPPPTPPITIVLPTVIAKPREQRQIEPPVVDVAPTPAEPG
jgi:hypothetical protein